LEVNPTLAGRHQLLLLLYY